MTIPAPAAPSTIAALRDDRAKVLNQIDAILDTAKEASRDLDDAERVTHDTLVAQYDGFTAQLEQAEADVVATGRHTSQASRKAGFDVPNINVKGSGSVGVGVTRDLNAMLWATTPTVTASNGITRAPVEQVIVRNSVTDVGSVAPRIEAFRAADREVIREFQDTVATMAIVGMMVDRDADNSKKGFEVARQLPQFKDRWASLMNAMDVDTAAEGGTWVPTGIGASLHEQVRASGKVAPLFQRINIPTNPWKWPIEGGDLTAYRVAEPISDSAAAPAFSTAGTVAATFDAEIFGARTLWSRSLDADSALAIAPYQVRKLVQAFVDAEEKAILDGDADGTHQDADTEAVGATHASSSWDGLRKKGLAQTVVTATTSTVANLGLLRSGMGKWGVNPMDLVFIVGVSAYHDLLSDTNLLTLDKFGPHATILNGQIGSIHGIPVIVSEHVRENLNASGVSDGITATKTYNLCVNRNEWAIGQRMALDVETDDVLYRETFQRLAVAFMREDFQHIGTAATNDDTAISFNVTP